MEQWLDSMHSLPIFQHVFWILGRQTCLSSYCFNMDFSFYAY
jgi:hypothetical protein